MGKNLVIIDGNSLINRAFYALPPLMTKEGIHTNGIYGFINILNKIKVDYAPDYMVVTFDKKAPTFRHIAYAEYKAGRKKMPHELAAQMPVLKEVLEALEIGMMELEGFEADDLIGTVARLGEMEDLNPIIITGDKDALQLATEKTKIVITKKGISEFEAYHESEIIEKYEITPHQLIDLKGLMGDKSDNIPGIPGVGEKTALKLLKEFHSIENLLKNTEQIKNEKLRLKVEEHVQLVLMSRKLGEINVEVPIEVDFNDYQMKEPVYERVVALYKKLEFNRLLAKIEPDEKKEMFNVEDVNMNYIKKKDDFEEMKSMLEGKNVILKVFSDYGHAKKTELLGLGLLLENDFYYIEHINQFKIELKDLLENNQLCFIGHDLKKDFYALKSIEIDNLCVKHDTEIGQYLIEPGKTNYDMKKLALEYLNTNIEDELEFMKNNSQVDLMGMNTQKYGVYNLNWCHCIKCLYDMQIETLEKDNLGELYREVELPLIQILMEMEYDGISVDADVLMEIGEFIAKKIDGMKSKIFEITQETFNLNSPKQLGVILFEKLNLPVIKKTKTGYSTNIDVLEKLYDQHEIIPMVIEYRQLAKLKSTYIDGLVPLINKKTKRIHPTFKQTTTATGRISCVEPNLQNIPVRQELGKSIRKAFVSGDSNKLLIAADYSQIELRVLAHLSEDENLIEAFKNDEDIHRLTASNVFNVPFDEVTDSQRSDAKAVNFGIIYGMSDFGLSENLNISIKEAGSYITAYFKKYASIKTYMDQVIESCKQTGYVVTIMDRKRYIPEINAQNHTVKNFGERLAMNTPIQGSAADIIKIAMIKVAQALKNENLKSKLLLQIHDELIIEVEKDELEQVQALMVREMEQAVALKVPLKVDVHIGENWYQLK